MPSTSARTPASLPGRAAGALALVCLALGAGRAAAQQNAGPPALPPPAVAVPYPPPPAALAAPQPAPAPTPDTPFRQTGLLQQPVAPPAPANAGAPAEEATKTRIELEPPGPERLFKLESEAHFFERIRQGGRDETPVDIDVFPQEPVLSRAPYYGRRWPAAHETAEANYVCYNRLLFEQKNFERGGWDLGAITPIVSALGFYKDFVTLPYHNFSDICRHYECSAGYCLPGDPTPLLLYPPEQSMSGSLAEIAAVAAVLAIFP